MGEAQWMNDVLGCDPFGLEADRAAGPYPCQGEPGCTNTIECSVYRMCDACNVIARKRDEDETEARRQKYAREKSRNSLPRDLKPITGFDFPELPTRCRGGSAPIKAARKAVERIRSGEVISATFNGPAGTGKTTLATAAWTELLYHPAYCHGLWLSVFDIANARRDSPLGTEPKLIVQACNEALILIDDLGAEVNYGAPAIAAISEVLHHRHNEGLTTLVTTGLPLDAIEKVYGAGILRRLTDKNRSTLVSWTWAAK